MGSAALAGAMVAGPVGAAAGAAAAALLWNKEVKGRVRLGLRYEALQRQTANAGDSAGTNTGAEGGGGGGDDDDDGLTRFAPAAAVPAVHAGANAAAQAGAAETVAARYLREAKARRGGAAPKGGTDEVDWRDLMADCGVLERACDMEFCCFVSNGGTDTQAALWRDTRRKRLLVAFRGTSDPGDLVTDAQVLQKPWVAVTTGGGGGGRGGGGKGSTGAEGAAYVHGGFRDAMDSISRRLKELVLAACDGDPSSWELLVTGHSLGGALAVLFTQDVARHGLDAGRGLPTDKPSPPWWGRLMDSAKKEGGSRRAPLPPRPQQLVCYTFGCPRVGNTPFAQLFDTLPAEAALSMYRVVNGADVVARLPRHGKVALQLLDYEHSGPTVLVAEPAEPAEPAEGDTEAAWTGTVPWVEGESDDEPCPLRDGSPLVDPLADGALLFEAMREGVARGSAKAALDKLLQVTPAELSQIVGLDSRFVAAELELATSLARGDAISHHLEPSYFAAMKAAHRAQATQRATRRQPSGAAAAAGGTGDIERMIRAAGIEVV